MTGMVRHPLLFEVADVEEFSEEDARDPPLTHLQ
jgi:hypothetical protein